MSTASSSQQHYFVLANNYERRALLENLVKKNRPNATVKVFAHPSARACFQTRNKYLESLDLGISRVWLDTPNKRIKHRRLVSFTQ